MAQIVNFGEVLLRLVTPAQGLFMQDSSFEANYCGAEANVATAMAGFGHNCQIVTALPKNELGSAALADLRKFNLSTAFVQRLPHRMGLFFLSPGAMSRPSHIIYDRANSAFAAIDADSFDWPTILRDADWLYVSGITAALGDGPLAALQAAIACARSKKVKVAFDSNYRPALWQGREAQGAKILTDLALKADLLFAGRRAIGMMVGKTFDNPDADQASTEATNAFFEFSPRISHIAATRREVITSDCHDLTALIASRSEVAIAETVRLSGIVDRIGTGDAFGAAILHGLITGMSLLDSANFARAAAQWSHSVRGDYLRATLDDINSLVVGGGGDVRR